MLLKFLVMKQNIRSKGTAKNLVKRQIRYDDYNQVLETNNVVQRSCKIFGVKTIRYIVSILQKQV